MLKRLLPILLAGFSLNAQAQLFPVSNIRVNGHDTNRVNLVFLAEGYTASELPKFVSDATGTTTTVFTQSPLREYRNFYNTYAIQVSSAESGTTHPGTATDVPEPASPITGANTYFNSTFDNNNTHRAIVCENGNGVYDVAGANLPSYDILYVLVNSTEYGGTGGGFCTSTMAASAADIAVHELGHTFGGLADEYWAGSIFAQEKPNMTQETNPTQVKWKNWIATGNIGIFPYGTTGEEADWYRPHQNCKMQFLGVPFCAVCKETMIDKMYEVVSPIDDYTPRIPRPVVITENSLDFTVKVVKPIPNTLSIKWQLNNTDLPGKDTFTTISNSQLSTGNNTLTAFVTDTTALSRSYRPNRGYQFSVSWNVLKFPTGVSSVENAGKGKFFYNVYPVPACSSLTLAYTNETEAVNLPYHIADITGKIVKKGNMPIVAGKQQTSFDISSLAPGSYILSGEGQQVSFNAKFVKE